RILVEADDLRRGARAARDADGADERRRLLAIVDAVHQRERNAARVGREDIARGGVHRVRALGALAAAREIAQRPEPPLADHLVRRLDDGTEDAADLAVFRADRAVGEGEIRLFGETAPVDQ